MASYLSASLTVEFAPLADGDTPRLLWEEHESTDALGNYVSYNAQHQYSTPLRLYYSASGASVWATLGKLFGIRTSTKIVRSEPIVLSGSNSATTKYPPSSGVTVYAPRGLQSKTGAPISPTIRVDANGNITLSEDAVGVLMVNYNTTYTLYEYQYKLTSTPSGYKIEGGYAVATLGDTTVTMEAPALSITDDLEPKEVYRVFVKTVVTPDAIYQQPEGWPDATCASGLPDPDDSYVVVDAVVEIGAVLSTCSTEVRQFYPELGDACPGSQTKYEIKLGDGATGGCSSRAQTIIAAAKARYGISG